MQKRRIYTAAASLAALLAMVSLTGVVIWVMVAQPV